jgi:hypothetical protein
MPQPFSPTPSASLSSAFRLRRYHLAMLEHFAEHDRTTVSGAVARELDAVASAHVEELSSSIAGFAARARVAGRRAGALPLLNCNTRGTARNQLARLGRRAEAFRPPLPSKRGEPVTGSRRATPRVPAPQHQRGPAAAPTLACLQSNLTAKG